MYNLAVDDAHTFAVGRGQWVVHNTCLDDAGAVWSFNREELRATLLESGLDTQVVDDMLKATHHWVNEDWQDILRAIDGQTDGIDSDVVRYAQVFAENLDSLPTYNGSAIRGIIVEGDEVAEIISNIQGAGSVLPGGVISEGRLSSYFAWEGPSNPSSPARTPYDGIIQDSNVVYYFPQQSSGRVIGNASQGEVLMPPDATFRIVDVQNFTIQDRLRLPTDHPLHLTEAISGIPKVTLYIELEEINP